MSQKALLGSVRDLLQRPVGAGTPADGFGWDSSICEVQLDGQPPPICGELFVAIHEGSWQSTYIEGRKDIFGVDLTITRRIAFVPIDRGRTPLMDAADALELWIDRLAAKLHMNYNVLDLAGGSYGNGVWTGGQVYSIASTANGFVEPLFFKGTQGPTRKVGPEWFMADTEGSEVPIGIVRTMSLGDAVRYQVVPSQS